jgi:trigger factor
MGSDKFAQEIVQAGQVPMLVGEVVRGKALALVLEQAKVLDESGREVDLESLREVPAEETIGELLEQTEELSTLEGEVEADTEPAADTTKASTEVEPGR